MTAGNPCSEANDAADFSRLVRRNSSLSTHGRIAVFAFLCFVSFGIAGAFALLGAWPVLPFAGLEMLVLYAALRLTERRAGDFERISIAGDRLAVEIREDGRTSRHEMSRYWTRLVRRGGEGVALRSHGREVEIGRFLTGAGRAALALELDRKLRP